MKLWPGQPDNWKPTAKDKGRFWAGLALCSFALAASVFISPSSSSLTGRWGWLHRIFFNEFGAAGDLILYMLIGAVALTVGVMYLSERKS